MKALIFGDLHLHDWGDPRTDAGLIFWKHVGNVVKTSKIDEIWVIGDLFHTNEGHPLSLIVPLLRILSGIKCKIRILTGNHDTGPGEEYAATELLTGLPNVELITQTKLFDFGLLPVQAVPYQYTLGAAQREIKPLKNDLGVPAQVLLGHQGIIGARVGWEKGYFIPDEKALPPESIMKHGYQYAFFGHYHKPQKPTKGVYCVGSPLQHFIDERGDKKRYIILTVEGLKASVKSVRYYGPEFQDIIVNRIVDLNNVKNKLGNCYVRVRLKSASVRPETVRKALAGKCLSLKIEPYKRKLTDKEKEDRLDLDLDDAASVETFVMQEVTKSAARTSGVKRPRIVKIMQRLLLEARSQA